MSRDQTWAQMRPQKLRLTGIANGDTGTVTEPFVIAMANLILAEMLYRESEERGDT